MIRALCPIALSLCFVASSAGEPCDPMTVATFNVEDLKADEPAERLARLAELIVRLDADVILLNEVDSPPDDLLAGVRPLLDAMIALDESAKAYHAIVRPTNTGEPSGFDLDNSGEVVKEPGSRAFGGDCFGYGEYAGQYGMALLVREPFVVDVLGVRTFREFLWKDMPDAALPVNEDGTPWYSEEELEVFRLASKTMMDVPVLTPGREVVHFICSHPTPPVFDGPEDRNGRRNHDEIRMLADYVSGAGYLVDDRGERHPLPDEAHFVILGDLNADPDEGDTYENPIRMLLEHPRVKSVPVPSARNVERAQENLDPDDTARFGLRADYVLPSSGLGWVSGMVIESYRDFPLEAGEAPRIEPERAPRIPSDHFPVLLRLCVPLPVGE